MKEDRIPFVVDVESSKAQQEIYKLEKSSRELREENKARMKQILGLEAAGKKESAAYKNLQTEYDKTRKKINANSKAIAEETQKININCLTMSQLRKESKQLQKQMDNTAKSLDPEAYSKLEERLKVVKERMQELKSEATSLKDVFNNDNTQSFLVGSGAVKLLEIGLSLAKKLFDKVSGLVVEGVEMAKSADGIRHAFDQLDRPDILDNLRKATHGTMNDVELMKAAVQARDFRIPLDQLGKYLEFAQLKAQQTGQSVDFMVQSIVTGLGRKSLMILDNLGLSAAQVKEEMKKGGDMATAVGTIIDRQLDQQGQHYEDAAEREKRAITEVQNAQEELGREMLPLTEAGTSMWNKIQIAALYFFTYFVKATKEGIAQFVDLYNNSATFRTSIELLCTSFKLVYDAAKFVFNFLYTSIKTVGQQFMNLGDIIEGAITLDRDKISRGIAALFTDPWKGIKEQYHNFERWGEDMGEHLIKGLNNVVDGHITAPSMNMSGSGSIKTIEEDLGDGDGSSGKKGNKDHQESLAALKLQKEVRQKALDQEKYFYEESVRAYKYQLAEKKISQQQFDATQLSLASAHAKRIVEKEKEQLETLKTMNFKDKKVKEAAILEQQRNIEKAENDSYNAQLAAYQNFQRNMENLENSGMSDSEREEYRYKMQLSVLDGYYKASLKYAQDHNEELLSIDLAYQQAKEKMEADHTLKLQQQSLRARQQYGLATLSKQLEIDKQLLEQTAKEQQWSEEQKLQAMLNLEQDYENKKLQIRQQYGLVGQTEQYQMQLDQLRQYYDQELLTTEEYEEAKKQLRMQNLKESFDYWQNQVSSAVSALQDAELAQVESKYDAEIAAAKKAGKDTSKLEEQKEAEKLNIQKKYADVNFAVKCSEIIANTAVAIMKALSELGPIAGPVAAALMGVTGAAQLMVAKAERDRIKNMTVGSGSSSSGTVSAARVATGLEGGGYLDVEREQDGKRYHAKYDPNRRGYVSRPTVIVGEGPAGQSKEWVASNVAVENPTVRPIIDAIDAAQRAGNIRTLDLNKVLLQRGLQSGGSIAVAPSVTTPGASVSGYSRTLARLVEILDRMEQNGIPALVGIDQIEAEQKLRDQARKIGSKHEDH